MKVLDSLLKCQELAAEGVSHQDKLYNLIISAKNILAREEGPLFHYIPEHLELKEVFPPTMLKIFKDKPLELWAMMNSKILWTADRIRDLYGEKIFVNINQHLNRGFRSSDSDVGVEYSPHKRGDAIDFNLESTPSHKIRGDIRDNVWKEEFKYINALESRVPWVHMDCRNWDKINNGILLMKG